MTDVASTAVNEPLGIVDALERSWRHADGLRLTADSVASTFQWLHVNKLRPILLLDYDVICGALPFLALGARIRQEASSNDVLSISRLAGPSMLRLLLERVEECVIPPGTAAELLGGIERSHSQLSARARHFVERIRDALKLQHPTEILTHPRYRDSRDLFLEDLTHFDQDIRDHQVLRNLLSRAIAVDSLLLETSKHSRTDIDAFKSQFDFLNSRRPGRQVNNFNDALNAALVVRLFNNTIMSSRLNRIPMLISNTRAIQELNRVSESYLRNVGLLQDRPFLFNDSLFLVIGQGLLERTQNRYGVAADEAAQIAREAIGLANGCLDLLRTSHRLTGRDTDRRTLTIADLPSCELEMLYWRREVFESHWGSIFAPSQVAAERDRVDYLRMLLSTNFREALESEEPDKLAQAVAKRIAALTHETSESAALWELFLQHRKDEKLIVISARAFDYYLCENDGTLLRNLHPTVQVGEALPFPLNQDHDFRVVMAPAYLSSRVVISIASFLKSSISPRRFLSFMWLHRSDSQTICEQLLKTLLMVPTVPDKVDIAVFTSQKRDNVTASPSTALKEIMDRLVPDSDGIRHVEFIQMKRGRTSVCADLQLLEGLEAQATLTLSAEDLTFDTYLALLRTMTATLEVPITSRYLRRVLKPVCRLLELEQVLKAESDPVPSESAQDQYKAGA